MAELRDEDITSSQAAALCAENAPLGILTLAAILKRDDHELVIFDLNRSLYAFLHADAERDPREEFAAYVAEELAATDADLYGFGTMWSTYPYLLRVAAALKSRRPHAQIVFGGPQASVVAKLTLDAFPSVDFVVCGEADEALPALVEGISGTKRLESIPGVTYRNQASAMENGAAPPVRDLDSLPDPAFHMYPEPGAGAFIPIELGRGCPFGCTFCSTNDFFSRRFRLRSPYRIIRQMQDLSAAYGVTAFDLIHDMFTANRNDVIRFCDAMIEDGNAFTWYCSARTDRIDDELIDIMHAAGCRGIFFGIESGAEATQVAIKKRLNLEEAARRVRHAARKGIWITTSTIIGFPDESVTDLEATVDLLMDFLREDYIDPQIHILTALKQTPLEVRYRDEVYLDDGYPDLSHSGWAQGAKDIEFIKANRDLFLSFYSLPLKNLDRGYVQDLRLFLKIGISRLRWLLVAMHQQRGPLLGWFERWRRWVVDEGLGKDMSKQALTRLLGSGAWIPSFLTFVEQRLRTHGTTVALEATLEYYSLLEEVLTEPVREPDPAGGGGKANSAALPRIAQGVKVIKLSYDLDHVVQSLRSGTTPGHEAGQPTYVVIRRSAGRLDTLSIRRGLAELLTMCDGMSSIGELGSRMDTSAWPPGLRMEDVARAGIAQLNLIGLLERGGTLRLPIDNVSPIRTYAGH